MRLNIGVSPSLLTDEQLFAESRELKFLPSYYKRFGKKSIDKVPVKFSLGRGYILFFAFKPTYSLKRYKDVLKECLRRGINVQDESWRWNVYDFTDSYKEEGWERDIIIDRICEKIRISPKKYFHYYHKRISKEEAIKQLTV